MCGVVQAYMHERRCGMQRIGSRLALVLAAVFSMLMLSGCGQGYGKLLEFNKGQLYYTPNVTAAEADKLGQYLVSCSFFDGNEKSVQLNKSGDTYEFRMVVKKGMQEDADYVALCKQMCAELSSEVFSGAKVDIHLCDERLETLRVVVAI